MAGDAFSGGDGTEGSRPLVAPALTIGVLAISFAAIFFRLAAPTPPLVSAGVRLTLAAALLLPVTLRHQLSGAAFRDAALAGLAYAFHFGTWVASLGLTSVAASVTLVTTTPLVLAVVALATGRDLPTRRTWLALAVGTGGVTVLGGADLGAGDALLGDALAGAGAVAMAAYLWLARRATAREPRLHPLAFQGVATGVGAVWLWGAVLVSGGPPAMPAPAAIGYLALAALLPQLVGHGLLTWALRHASPTVVGIATLGEPVGSTLLGWLWLGEVPGAPTLTGCAIVLAAVAMALTGRRAPRPRSGEARGRARPPGGRGPLAPRG